jgi:hypothetical protein
MKKKERKKTKNINLPLKSSRRRRKYSGGSVQAKPNERNKVSERNEKKGTKKNKKH